jgi:hypothetical protein
MSALPPTAAESRLLADLTGLERRVDDLRAFEREYRSRVKAYLYAQLAELDSDIAVASREDLRTVLTLLSLHLPPEVRVGALLDRLAAAARGDAG